MKKIKKENAITLVTLIITIVILLILAGISISALTQTGLFENTKQAKQKSEETQERENITLADYENKIEENLKGTTRENENNDIYDISTYSMGTATVYDSRITDLQGGYKVIGNTVYVYLTAKTTKTFASGSWALVTNLPKCKNNMPLNVIIAPNGLDLIGGINCGVSPVTLENITTGSIRVVTSSTNIPANSSITIIGSYPKE